jgi:CheY-like chemotaxis protein
MNTAFLSIGSARLRATPPDPSNGYRPGPSTVNPAGADKAPSPPPRSLHILCIDDDEQILDMMKECLTHFGHQVRVASGGKYGVELFRTAMLKSEPCDVVITDLGMPDMDGHEAARMIKAESPSTPIIMMTGEARTSKPGGAAVSAVDVVVGKPPCIKELNDLLLRMAGE